MNISDFKLLNINDWIVLDKIAYCANNVTIPTKYRKAQIKTKGKATLEVTLPFPLGYRNTNKFFFYASEINEKLGKAKWITFVKQNWEYSKNIYPIILFEFDKLYSPNQSYDFLKFMGFNNKYVWQSDSLNWLTIDHLENNLEGESYNYMIHWITKQMKVEEQKKYLSIIELFKKSLPKIFSLEDLKDHSEVLIVDKYKNIISNPKKLCFLKE